MRFLDTYQISTFQKFLDEINLLMQGTRRVCKQGIRVPRCNTNVRKTEFASRSRRRCRRSVVRPGGHINSRRRRWGTRRPNGKEGGTHPLSVSSGIESLLANQGVELGLKGIEREADQRSFLRNTFELDVIKTTFVWEHRHVNKTDLVIADEDASRKNGSRNVFKIFCHAVLGFIAVQNLSGFVTESLDNFVSSKASIREENSFALKKKKLRALFVARSRVEGFADFRVIKGELDLKVLVVSTVSNGDASERHLDLGKKFSDDFEAGFFAQTAGEPTNSEDAIWLHFKSNKTGNKIGKVRHGGRRG